MSICHAAAAASAVGGPEEEEEDPFFIPGNLPDELRPLSGAELRATAALEPGSGPAPSGRGGFRITPQMMSQMSPRAAAP